ncbi:hypothetical protein H920_11764 [Fukomys damarensis]|uniref:Uncharacterized protein n=1 Tax=Fukomys damarensis TaxID=885580 RepID=A0A091D434_FUKDA|nr:hypothetical protein H920_11764 [Fukomys damarensis]
MASLFKSAEPNENVLNVKLVASGGPPVGDIEQNACFIIVVPYLSGGWQGRHEDAPGNFRASGAQFEVPQSGRNAMPPLAFRTKKPAKSTKAKRPESREASVSGVHNGNFNKKSPHKHFSSEVPSTFFLKKEADNLVQTSFVLAISWATLELGFVHAEFSPNLTQ